MHNFIAHAAYVAWRGWQGTIRFEPASCASGVSWLMSYKTLSSGS